MIKNITALIVVATLSTGVMASLTKTKIEVLKDPTVKQLEKAREILTEAIEAKKNGDLAKFQSKLKKAKKYQQKRKASKTYNAAFLATLMDSHKVNYFVEILDDDFSELRYEVMIDKTCFVGTVKEANKLLTKMLSTDVLNYDEEWYANSRVKNNKEILVDLVDGPNEYTSTSSIFKCK